MPHRNWIPEVSHPQSTFPFMFSSTSKTTQSEKDYMSWAKARRKEWMTGVTHEASWQHYPDPCHLRRMPRQNLRVFLLTSQLLFQDGCKHDICWGQSPTVAVTLYVALPSVLASHCGRQSHLLDQIGITSACLMFSCEGWLILKLSMFSP